MEIFSTNNTKEEFLLGSSIFIHDDQCSNIIKKSIFYDTTINYNNHKNLPIYSKLMRLSQFSISISFTQITKNNTSYFARRLKQF